MSAKNGSQAVVRALRLLKLFNDDMPELTVGAAVTQTGLNRTTVFRLLSALQDEGFVQRLPSGTYSLGAESLALGGLALRHNTLWQAAHPILQQLAEEVQERVTLEIPSLSPSGETSMLVVDEIAGPHRIGVRNFVGEHLPIHATSTGKAILAHMPAEQRRAILGAGFKRLTSNTLIDGERLSAELVQVRQQGYATAFEELEDGLIACAVPIFDMQRRVCAAVSIVGPTIRISSERVPLLLEALTKAGHKISSSVGFT